VRARHPNINRDSIQAAREAFLCEYLCILPFLHPAFSQSVLKLVGPSQRHFSGDGTWAWQELDFTSQCTDMYNTCCAGRPEFGRGGAAMFGRLDS